MLKKFFLSLLILIIGYPSAFGMTFEELANGYDYAKISSYSKIIAVSHEIDDDKLMLNLRIHEKNADFDYIILLNNQSRSYSHHCFEECEYAAAINFSLNAVEINNNVSVKVFKNGFIEDSLINFYNFNINDSAYDGLEKRTVNITADYESNGLLFLNLSLTNFDDGIHELKFYISSDDEDYFFIKTVEVADNKSAASFELGHNSRYRISSIISEEDIFVIDYITQDYDFSRIISINESLIDGNISIDIVLDENHLSNYYLYDCLNQSLQGFGHGFFNSQNKSFRVSPYNDDNSTVCFPLNLVLVIEGHTYYYQTSYYNISNFENSIKKEDAGLISSIAGAIKSVADRISAVFVKNDTQTVFFENMTKIDETKDGILDENYSGIKLGSELQPIKNDDSDNASEENAASKRQGFKKITAYVLDEKSSYLGIHYFIFYIVILIGLVMAVLVFVFIRKLPQGVKKY